MGPVLFAGKEGITPFFSISLLKVLKLFVCATIETVYLYEESTLVLGLGIY